MSSASSLRVDALKQRAEIFELPRERVLELGFVRANELVLDVFDVTAQVSTKKLGFLRRDLEVHGPAKCITRTAGSRRAATPG